MKEHLNVAILQLAAYDRAQFSSIGSKLLEMIATTASEGAELIVCPEGTIPAYVLGPGPVDENEYLPFLALLETLICREKIHLVCGGLSFPPKSERPENAALIFGPNGLIAAVGKRFLWHFDRYWFVAGNSLDPVQTAIGKLGIVICADGRIPTFASTLVDRGAEILIVPTAWVSNAANLHSLENIQADLFAPVRAWENGVPLLAANKVGVERESVLYCGKSQIIAADGTVIVRASDQQPEILRHTISSTPPRPLRCTLSQERPSQAPRVSAPPRRIAVTQELSAAQYDVARWSDVDVILTLENPNDSPNTHRAESPEFCNPEIIALNTLEGAKLYQQSGLPVLIVDDTEISDPGMLPHYALAGIDCCIWQMSTSHQKMRIPLARTRAIELRMYVVALARNPQERSFVIDPDGILLGGTTAEYRMFQWVYDPSKTVNTMISPGTDILEGLALANRLSHSVPSP